VATQRGRKSAAKLSIAAPVVQLSERRITPPADLTGEARQVFVGVVASVAGDHFRPADVLLLAALSRAAVLEKRAYQAIEACDVDDPVGLSDWLKAHQKQCSLLATLATRLRLTPHSRMDARTTGKPTPKPSAYAALEMAGE
jgi:hypothetical protein